MTSISVILPAMGRPESVLCALVALGAQRGGFDVDDVDVIVVDDSPDDSVFNILYGSDAVVSGPLLILVPPIRYIRSSPPRVGRFTASRARNIGAANSRSNLIVFIDQDVMLAPDALTNYARAYEHHGDNTVILGLYHWLQRIDFKPQDVVQFDDIFTDGLAGFKHPQNYLFKRLEMDEPGPLGPDIREKDFSDDIDHVVDDAALGCFSGNIGYPRKLFIELGGFDEAINRHGGEDADLGLTARERGAKFLLWNRIWGLHRWHSRNQKQNVEDVQANIDYIDRKHGIGKYADAHKWMDARDWSDWRHYHKEVGGILLRAEGNNTIWACREGHRLGLPDPSWIRKLGLSSSSVLQVPPSGLLRYVDEGVARDD